MTCAAMRAHQVLATVLFECSKSFCVRIREYFEENYQQKNECSGKGQMWRFDRYMVPEDRCRKTKNFVIR